MGVAQSSLQQEKQPPSIGFFDSPAKQVVTNVQKNSESKEGSFWSSILGASPSKSNGYVKVLFCGKDHFPSAFAYTKEELLLNRNVVVLQCDQNDIEREIADTHVIIPLMSKITRDLIEKAPLLNLIMQFGVGLEGVDVEAASEHGIAVRSVALENITTRYECFPWIFHQMLVSFSI